MTYDLFLHLRLVKIQRDGVGEEGETEKGSVVRFKVIRERRKETERKS